MDSEFMLLKQGIDMMCNFHIAEADQVFSALNDVSPAFALHYAETAFFRAVLTEDAADVKVAFERISAAKKLSQKIKKAPVEGPYGIENLLMAKICLSGITLFDAALKFRLQMQLKAIYNFRKAWKYAASANETRKSLPLSSPCYKELCSYVDLDMGIFHFLVSVVPREFMWVVEGVGFKGDRKLGLAELANSYELDGPHSWFAAFHFVWIHSFFNEDFPEGEKWLAKLQRYPNGALFSYLGGYVYRKQGKLAEATKAFETAFANSHEMKQIQNFCDYEIGYNSYLNLDWERAASLLKKFLDTSKPESFRCYATFQLAICYEMLLRPADALEQMKNLLPYVRKGFDYDEFAERKANKYIKLKGFTSFERQFQVAMILQEACAFEQCLKTVDALASQARTEEEKARVSWLQGFCYHRLSRPQDAKKNLLAVVDAEKVVTSKDSLMIIPHALCDLGEILTAENQLEAAEKTLKKAKTYQGYDFCQLLEWRITKDLDIVKSKQAQK
eukprot:TRINITY_DN6227_c0_g1_i1.p1 TRINITY_DN6227_c0_g1~~TRINITY_DN6227_c0_g1_i1.p1  ORF type:complete len:503 (+),score=199.29 TRINITY_DN6227_c0_g1_i1:73-1581(+)